MKYKVRIFLVGGAIRNKILCQKIEEKDWLVVGSNPINLLKLNFINVGNTFPVFLHPKTKEEYSLARIEKKVGVGYIGFDCTYDSFISLKEDLKRRDLTINSIAQDYEGKIIDPYDGVKDIKRKVLKNVSNAFVEDPLRILRVARFAAQFYHIGFKIHINLFYLMEKIVKKKELEYLSFNRIFKEVKKALLCKNPDIFFKILHYINALKFILPFLYKLWIHNSKKNLNKIFYNLYLIRQKTKNEKIINTLFINNILLKNSNKNYIIDNLNPLFATKGLYKLIKKIYIFIYNIELIEEAHLLYIINYLNRTRDFKKIFFLLKIINIVFFKHVFKYNNKDRLIKSYNNIINIKYLDYKFISGKQLGNYKKKIMLKKIFLINFIF